MWADTAKLMVVLCAVLVEGQYTWTARSAGSGLRCVTFQNDLFVAAGTSGMTTSTDGLTWNPTPSPPSGHSYWGVAFGNNLWVMIGGDDKIATSSDDCTTYTVRTAPSPSGANDWYDLVFGNNLLHLLRLLLRARALQMAPRLWPSL